MTAAPKTITTTGVTHEVVGRLGYWVVRCEIDVGYAAVANTLGLEVDCMACIAQQAKDEQDQWP